MRTISKPWTRLGEAMLAASLATFIFTAMQTPAAADTFTIHLKTQPNRYDPVTLNVKVGDTVIWVVDGGQHTVTPDANQPDPFPGSQTLSPGQSYSVVISGSPRTIKYHCQ